VDSEFWIFLAATFVIGYVLLNFYNGICYAIAFRKSEDHQQRQQRLFENSERLQAKTAEQNDRFDKILDGQEALLRRVETIICRFEQQD
jgi:hypothetical protein